MEDRTFEENLVNDGMAQADAKVTEAEEERHDGQIKCPKCGSTDIELNPKTGKLRCNFCRHIFEPEFTEDDLKDGENKIQKITDKAIERVDKAIEDKSKEILTV